jgi:ABC-type nitrate/sulfonate/bicarbonate transport system permease component
MSTPLAAGPASATAPAVADTAGSRARRRLRRDGALLPVAGIVVALGLWQAVAAMHFLGIWTNYISDPVSTVKAGYDMTASGELWANAKNSLSAFGIGFALSVGIGIPIGMLMGWNRTVRQLLEPPMMALNATPRLALLPVIVVWLGIGVKSTVVVVFLDAVIPVIVNGMAGIRDVDVKLVQVARSFGAGRRELFAKVLLPASTPALLTGVRLGVSRGVLGVIVAQLYVSTVGIGYLISNYGEQFQVDQIMFLVLLVAVFAYVINLALARLERRFESWRGVV